MVLFEIAISGAKKIRSLIVRLPLLNQKQTNAARAALTAK